MDFVSGHVPGQDAYVRHTWLAVDGAIVDLTADPFGEPPVVVGTATRFYDSLDAHEVQDGRSVLAGLNAEEANRLQRLLAPIVARLNAPTP